MKQKSNNRQELKGLEGLARLMDAQFRIPGTNIRFGVDGIIGLVPGVGYFFSFLISSYLLMMASNKGASGFVMARMTLNTVIDALIGAIPFAGDIFDIAFKANQRNVRLLQQHFGEGKHQGGSRKVIIPLVIVLLLVFVGLIWGLVKLFQWIF